MLRRFVIVAALIMPLPLMTACSSHVAPTEEELLIIQRVDETVIGLAGNDPVVRRNAARDLGRIKSSRAVSPLLKALMDEDLQVRMAAARALGEINDPKAIKPLIKLLRKRDDAVDIMIEEGDKKDDVYRGAVKSVAREHNVLAQSALEALRAFRDPRIVKPLIKALKDEDRHVRAEAARMLGEYKDVRAVKPLIELLRDSHPVVREGALDALVNIGGPAIEPLIETVIIGDAEARSSATATLSRIGSPAIGLL